MNGVLLRVMKFHLEQQNTTRKKEINKVFLANMKGKRKIH